MLWLDSADPKEIEWAQEHASIGGVTTNPSILKRDGATLEDVFGAVRGGVPVNVEVSGPWQKMIRDARDIQRQWQSAVIKFPMTLDGMRACREWVPILRAVNVTAVMNVQQGILAAQAGATYVSVFWNRIRDGKEMPQTVMGQLRGLYDRQKVRTKIVAASIRSVHDVTEAFQFGADIVTVPPHILRQMFEHPETDRVLAEFDAAIQPRETYLMAAHGGAR